MKLSFPPIGRKTAVAPLSAEFAVMLVGVAARQAASPTALMAHDEEATRMVEEKLLAPEHGAFNQAVADEMKRWKEGSPRRPEE